MIAMRLFSTLPLLSLLLSPSLSLTTNTNTQQPLPNSPPTTAFTLRPLTASDLDDITTVLIDAFGPGPVWQYLQPHQDEYAKYAWRCTRKDIGDQFERKPNNTFANVITVPSEQGKGDGARVERAVAVAVWKVYEPGGEIIEWDFRDVFLGRGVGGENREDVLNGNDDCLPRRDVNMTRAMDYSRQALPAEERYIHSLNRTQMHLGLLATHPDWDGHDFGATECRWGIERARAEGWPTTLLGTPAGWPLYDSLGFESLANVTIEMLDGLGTLWYEYMRLEPGA